MKRKKMEDGANCTEFNLKNFEEHRKSRIIQFCYADKFKNEFIDYMWSFINKYREEDKEFSNALDYINNQPKNSDKIVNKEERNEKLSQAYKIVGDKVNTENIISRNERTILSNQYQYPF